MKTRFPNFSDPERLRPGIDEFLEQVFYTDAILIYSPSQISLAAIIHSASTSKENVDEYITKILFPSDERHLSIIIEAVKSIDFLYERKGLSDCLIVCFLLLKRSVLWCGACQSLHERPSKPWKRNLYSAAIPTTTAKAQRNAYLMFCS